jgi:hypothetical protein
LAGLANAGADGVGGGVTVSVALRFTPPALAVMVADVVLVTPLVVTLKVALLAPVATVTALGTVATPLLLDNVTTAPSGAGPLSVTVPCAAAPPLTVDGDSASDDAETVPGAPSGAGSTQRIG